MKNNIQLSKKTKNKLCGEIYDFVSKCKDMNLNKQKSIEWLKEEFNIGSAKTEYTQYVINNYLDISAFLFSQRISDNFYLEN